MRIRTLLIVLICLSFAFGPTSANAQQAIIQLESDDTLPIANSRFDDAVEPPKENFTSANKNDPWEKFERGDLDQKAFIRLQEDYQKQAKQSRDPYIKRKRHRKMMAAKKRRARIMAAQKAKASKARAPASAKSKSKKHTKSKRSKK